MILVLVDAEPYINSNEALHTVHISQQDLQVLSKVQGTLGDNTSTRWFDITTETLSILQHSNYVNFNGVKPLFAFCKNK